MKCKYSIFLKNTSLFIVSIIWSTFSFCQQSDSPEFKNLQQSSSTANTLLGIAETDIARPAEPTDFLISLRQATDNFSSLPLKYGIEMAPVWIFNGSNISANTYLCGNSDVWDNVTQSFTISLAFDNNDKLLANEESISNTGLAIGAKVSIFRGNITSNTNSQLLRIRNLMSLQNQIRSLNFEEISSQNLVYQAIQSEMLNTAINSNISEQERTDRLDSLNRLIGEQTSILIQAATLNDTITERLNNQLKNFKLLRSGLKLDFNIAASWNMPDKAFENNKLDRFAFWLSGGYENESNNLSILGIVKYQYIGEQNLLQIAESKSLDAGLRAIFTKGKLSISFETIYRKLQSGGSYKYIFNADYLIGDNTRLNLSFGKDFDGIVSREGNVISALNFLKGFGSKRPIGNGS